jgi:phenylpyruvate tautomerase PptA (4-oxalocrotonate tautomerase family)
MPMIEVTTTKGALDDDAKQRLADELSTIVLELEAAPLADFSETKHMEAITWCFVNEQEVFVGGNPFPKPLYRVVCTLPEGASGVLGPLAGPGREQLVKRVTAAVLEADGSPNTMVEAHRVWVQIRQITNGHWAGFGEVVTLPELAEFGLGAGEPGSKAERMRAAALESVAAGVGVS